MGNEPETNIALSFNNIHYIITRGLTVSIKCIRKGIIEDFSIESHRVGLFNYIRALASVLNAHHLTEDGIAFPYFRGILPNAPFDILIKQHQAMAQVLDEVKLAVDKCDRNEQYASEMNKLESALNRLNKIWHPHIKIEVDTFITKIDALLPVEERRRLVQQFSEHGQKNAMPPYLTVPFMLYNLPEDERKLFMQGMPSEIIQHLVPNVWKPKWISMEPYFLP